MNLTTRVTLVLQVEEVGGAHWRGPGMAGGGRRKECGSRYPDRLVFQEKPWTGVWGWQPLTI